ncbi:hypothetical protein ES703_85518 [subsurface metagenome]
MDDLDNRTLNLPAVVPAFVTAELNPVQMAFIGNVIDLPGRPIDKNTDNCRVVF